MTETFAHSLREWQNFYELVGTAAATLIGLVFVAITMGTRVVIAKAPTKIQTFVTPTLRHFTEALIFSAVMLIPIETRSSLAVLLAVFGISGVGYVSNILRSMLRIHREKQMARNHWLWHCVLPLVGHLCALGTAIGLVLGHNKSLVGLAVSVLLYLVIGIRNAWDLTLRLIDMQAQPNEESSGE